MLAVTNAINQLGNVIAIFVAFANVVVNNLIKSTNDFIKFIRNFIANITPLTIVVIPLIKVCIPLNIPVILSPT